MRIVIAHNTYLERGGEDSVVEAEYALLTARGHEVARFTIGNEAIDGMNALTLGTKTVWNHDSYRQLRSFLQLHRPDVVHFHNTLPLISPSGYAAARAEGAAVVQTLHNYRLVCPSGLMYRAAAPCDLCVSQRVPWPGVQHACYRGSRAATAAVATMLTWHRATGTYRKLVDRFIALTDFARATFTRGGLDPSKVVVKPNFLADDPAIGPGGDSIVYVGRLSHEKGVLDLLRAWGEVGQGRLRIIGDGPLEQEVRDASAALPNVEVLGRLGRQATLQHLQQALVTVFPSRWYEGMPMAIIESFATGTPVLAYRHGAAAEMIEHERNGWLVEPHDVASLTRVLRTVTDDPDVALALRGSARTRFEAAYGADENYAQLLSIYRTARGSVPR